jgi:hypothetical protein
LTLGLRLLHVLVQEEPTMGHECLACHQDFNPRYNVPAQQFCSKSECQQKRRSEWQRQKLIMDPDYREYQKKAKINWREQHRDYMRNYRRENSAYCDRDRQQCRARHGRAAEGCVAAVVPCAVKIDECTSEKTVAPIETGYFRVCRVVDAGAVNIDACFYGSLVQLIVVQEDRAFSPVHGGLP